MEIWRFFYISKPAKFEPFYTKDPWAFFSAKFHHFALKYPIQLIQRIFVKRVYQIHWILRIFIFFPEIAIVRQWVLARCKKYTKILEIVYFPLWPIAKFGWFLLWVMCDSKLKRFQVVKFENSPRNHSMSMMSKNKYIFSSKKSPNFLWIFGPATCWFQGKIYLFT